MLFTKVASACVLATVLDGAYAATLYMAGDSTMAKGGLGVGTNTQGWGVQVAQFLNLTVVDSAIAGRSARSYTREGRFGGISNLVKPGDFVLIEFGHNDGGSLTPTDDGRSDCPGTGAQTCQTVYNGMKETVYTYPKYIENAVNLLKSKGATVIVASQTPDNTCENNPSCTYVAGRFVGYAQLAAQATGVVFIDHGAYSGAAYKALGAAVVDTYYPHDHTHTSPEGARTIAKAFLQGLSCSSSTLKKYIKAGSVNGKCL